MALAALLAAPVASALTYYWDNDGTTSGFGTAVKNFARLKVTQIP